MSNSVEPQIQHFAAAVAKMDGSPALVASDLLEALTLRENLARALSQSSVEASEIDQLSTADGQLKQIFEGGKSLGFADRVSQWRAAMGAGSDAWWWHLDETSDGANTKMAWYWTALGGLLLAIAVGLMTEVATRFLKDGPDLYGGISITIQAMLAIVAGSALTEGGRLRLSQFLDELKVPKRSLATGTIGIAVATFAFALLVYLLLPLFAHLYNDYGDSRRIAGSLVEASDAFKRAIALQPDYPQAHYNLAVIYEDIRQLDKAIAEYRTAVALDSNFGRAQNNLAHAILAEGKYPGVALGILDKLISQFANATLPADEQYAAYKNRAWAKIVLNEPRAAEPDLRKALEVKANGASAHCLLSKALDGSASTDAQKAEIRAHWEACLTFASADTSVEAAWLVEARRKLQTK